MGIGAIRGWDTGPRCDACGEVIPMDQVVQITGEWNGESVDKRLHPHCFQESDYANAVMEDEEEVI